MKKIITLIIITSLTFINILAQNASKGYKNLEKKEIEKAKEIFDKIKSKDSNHCAAIFGLAVIYSMDKYPKKDYYKAWDYFKKADENFSNLSDDDKVALKQHFTITDIKRRSRSLRQNFDIERAIIHDKLIKFVREENKLEYAERFIEEYPDSKYLKNVIHIRNYIEFRTAEKQNTLEAFNSFIDKYPDAAQILKANELRDQLAFINAKQANTFDALNNFINNYPEAKQNHEAQKLRDKLAFDIVKNKNTIEAVENFIKKYPNSLNIPNALKIKRQLIFERAKKINTLEAYNEFVRMYPEGEHYIDIFNLKANVLGNKIKNEYNFGFSNLQWIKGFDNDGKCDYSGDFAIYDNGNIVLVANTLQEDTNGTDAWIVCLNNNGKMKWNKTYGKQLYDAINTITISSNNEIILGGYQNVISDTVENGKAWILKLNQNGKLLWSRIINAVEINDIATNSANEIIAGGYYIDTTGQNKYLVSKINPNGKVLWTRNYSSTGIVNSIAVNESDEIIVAGNSWICKLDNDGYIKWERELAETDSCCSLTMSSQFIYFTGINNNKQIRLFKIDKDNNMLWDKTIGQNNNYSVNSFAVGQNNKLIICGNSGDNMFITKLDENGEIIWEKNPVTNNNINTTIVNFDKENNIFINATYKSSTGQDVFILKFSE